MAEMQTVTVDEAGTRLAYLDSEAPSSDTYTTLVIVHGYSYHARNFSRLFPIAKDYNLRVIALNRRDYVGSTPFSVDELAAVNDGDESAQFAFLQARGREIARFLVWAITEKKIPKASANGKEGGLALMGWSFGNLTTLAFLRHLKSYSKEVIETIAPYLRTFFIYETGSGTLGYPAPDGGYHPLYDKTIPARMLGIYFGTWVSSYYKHPYYSDSATGNRERSISSLQIRIPESSQVYRPCTLDTIKPDELISCIDTGPATRSDLLSISREVKYDQTQGSLLLDYTSPYSKDSDESNDTMGSRHLTDVKICDLYCDASAWSIPWGIWELEKDVEGWRRQGRKLRPINFLRVQGGNHFVHWDEPELFLKSVRDGIMS